MIRPDHPRLSIVRQCRLASIGRSSFYHVPRGEGPENLGLMGKIDYYLALLRRLLAVRFIPSGWKLF